MTGEYIGHTKTKVEIKLKSARGGVLFIDEAYELGKGMYGTEAITCLVKFLDVILVTYVVIFCPLHHTGGCLYSFTYFHA